MTYRRCHPALQQRLRIAIASSDKSALCELLLSLSNSEQHTAGAYLSEELLPAMIDGEAFAELLLATVPAHPKAFLGTFLKAAVVLYKSKRLNLPSMALEEYAQTNLSTIDRRKVLEALLPIIDEYAQAEWLFRLFGGTEIEVRIALLARTATAPAAYLLFQLLRQEEGNMPLLRHACGLLLRRGDRLAFNLTSILQAYFDIDNLPATFSLSLAPYQLSRLEGGYSSFTEQLLSI